MSEDSTPGIHILDDRAAAQIVHIEEWEPQPAQTAPVKARLHDSVRTRLNENGFTDLFSHQAHAIDHALAGKDVLVVTGTNSGKSLCYNVPALHIAASEPAARILYLFPTKALAQDQLGRLEGLAGPLLRAGTYDGDTPPSHRSAIRRQAHAILTNPDMLHVGILPGHEHWIPFLKSLRLIVIDEMHVYRGVFGSHVAGVLRRLLRMAEWHRSRPQIIACSATIGNPAEAFAKLTGRTPIVVAEDGSPKSKRTFAFFNPPLLEDGSRLSANVASAEILTSLMAEDKRTLVFSRSRLSAELVLQHTRDRLKGGVQPNQVDSYRAGYTAKERRTIEQALFKGKLLGLSATNAMELGVDIGTLDAVVMNGYPGSVASFRQQAGRAGRGTRPGLSVFVAHDDPLEQFLLRSPERLLRAENETISLNPENPHILTKQLLCAAHERPIAPSEVSAFGESALDLAESLDRSGELAFRSGRFYYPSIEPPAPTVNIRGSSGDEIQLAVDADTLGTMEYWRALSNAHQGAIYLHRGQTYMVKELDLGARRARMTPCSVDYYTQPYTQSVIQSKFTLATRDFIDHRVSLVAVTVTDSVLGYRVKAVDNGAVRDTIPLELPPLTYDSLAVRFDLPFNPEDMEDPTVQGGIHGLEHALTAVAPIFAGCDRGDLGSAWYALHPDSFTPSVFILDKTPGGVGLAERLFEDLPAWLSAATQLLTSCPCEEGCPGCMLSARCESNNEPLAKQRTLTVLSRFRGPLA